jgi:hypothetical protein
MIDLGKPSAAVAGRSDPSISQRKNQALEIKRNSFKQATVDLLLAVPVIVVINVPSLRRKRRPTSSLPTPAARSTFRLAPFRSENYGRHLSSVGKASYDCPLGVGGEIRLFNLRSTVQQQLHQRILTQPILDERGWQPGQGGAFAAIHIGLGVHLDSRFQQEPGDLNNVLRSLLTVTLDTIGGSVME